MKKMLKVVSLMLVVLSLSSCFSVNSLVDYSPEITFLSKKKSNKKVTIENYRSLSINDNYITVVDILGEGVEKAQSVGIENGETFIIYYWQDGQKIISCTFISYPELETVLYSKSQTLLQ